MKRLGDLDATRGNEQKIFKTSAMGWTEGNPCQGGHTCEKVRVDGMWTGFWKCINCPRTYDVLSPSFIASSANAETYTSTENVSTKP